MVPPERSARRPLDAVALAHVSDRLRRTGTVPWLHGEVARRMAERLSLVKRRPEAVVDWDGAIGGGAPLLAAAYPRARLLRVETDPLPRPAPPPAPWWRPRRAEPEFVAASGLGPGCCQLLWSNMALHGAIDPQAVMAAWHRALAVDGFLMFSTLGPGTFESLRALYRRQGWGTPHAPFVDMHDLGDMLVEAGFADPVMDQETLRLHWPSGRALLDELRQLGANIDPQRHPGLRTPRWRDALAAALERAGAEPGRPQLEFEIVYGHAFRVAPRPRVAPETALPLDDLRAMVRAGRRPG